MRSAKRGETPHGRRQARLEQLERLALQQHVGVVGEECAGRAEVQDAAGLAGELGEVAQVRDHVVARVALDLGDAVEVDGVGDPLVARRAAPR